MQINQLLNIERQSKKLVRCFAYLNRNKKSCRQLFQCCVRVCIWKWGKSGFKVLFSRRKNDRLEFSNKPVKIDCYFQTIVFNFIKILRRQNHLIDTNITSAVSLHLHRESILWQTCNHLLLKFVWCADTESFLLKICSTFISKCPTQRFKHMPTYGTV